MSRDFFSARADVKNLPRETRRCGGTSWGCRLTKKSGGVPGTPPEGFVLRGGRRKETVYSVVGGSGFSEPGAGARATLRPRKGCIPNSASFSDSIP